MNLPSKRMVFFIGFLLTVLLLALAAYLQFYAGINPCPLCIVQRICFLMIAIIFLIGAISNRKKWLQMMLGWAGFLLAAAGTFFSAKQVWLQHLPPSQNSECEVSLQYLLQVLPLKEVIKQILAGGGADCGRADWSFLNVTLAEWSLVCFVFFILLSLTQILRR